MSSSRCGFNGNLTNLSRELRSFVGILVARSSVLAVDTAGSIFLELEDCDKRKVKVIASGIVLTSDISCGHYYKLSNLKPRKVTAFKDVLWQLLSATDIEAVDYKPMEITHNGNEGCSNEGSDFNNICGKITAIDEDFSIYELDYTNTLVLSYYQQYCFYPKLECGDEVQVTNAHRHVGPGGKVYYVLCARGYMDIIGSTKPSYIPPHKNCSVFMKSLTAYGLNIECLLWMREALHVTRTSFNEAFLKSLGVETTAVVYVDIVLKLLVTSETIANLVRAAPYKRNVLREFFADKHECLAMRQENLQLPPTPMSISSFLSSTHSSDPPEEENGESWIFNVFGDKNNHPILAYLELSTENHRLCVQDGSGVEVVLITSKPEGNIGRELRSLHKRLVVIDKPIVVKEYFLEDSVEDIAANYLGMVCHEFIYFVTNSNNMKLLGPWDHLGFSNWKEITVNHFLEIELSDSNLSRQDLLRSPPTVVKNKPNELRQLDLTARFVVLHKTPLIMCPKSHELHGYIMVRSHPDNGSSAIEAGLDSCIFLRIGQTHADIFDLISSPGEIELRFPKHIAAYIKNSRSTIPYTYSLKFMLNKTQCISIPPEVRIDVVSPQHSVMTDVYSLSEALDFSGEELINVKAVIVHRINDVGKYDHKLQGVSNNHFGLPGNKTVIILDIRDVSGEPSARVYLRWPKSHLYPLGLLPGATVVLNFIYKSKHKESVYFRSTNLTSVDIICPLSLSDFSLTMSADSIPNKPWLLLHEIAEMQSGWCFLSSLYLFYAVVEAICKECGEAFENGMCSFQGCFSTSDPKLKANARVSAETLNMKCTIFIRDENVQVLFGMTDEQWQSLLKLASINGPLKYFGRNHVNKSDVQTKLYLCFCRRVLQGKSFHGYIRRFKSKGNMNTRSFFCISLRLPTQKTALEGAQSSDRQRYNVMHI